MLAVPSQSIRLPKMRKLQAAKRHLHALFFINILLSLNFVLSFRTQRELLHTQRHNCAAVFLFPAHRHHIFTEQLLVLKQALYFQPLR
jgi:hypothetical protein